MKIRDFAVCVVTSAMVSCWVSWFTVRMLTSVDADSEGDAIGSVPLKIGGSITVPETGTYRVEQGGILFARLGVKALKSLEEYNQEAREAHRISTDPRPNGIACPECGSELIDSAPGFVLTSNPPQKYVSCPKCEYQGYAVL